MKEIQKKKEKYKIDKNWQQIKRVVVRCAIIPSVITNNCWKKKENRRRNGRRCNRGCGGGVGKRAQKGGGGRCKIVSGAQSQENRSWSSVCRTPAQHSLPCVYSIPVVRLRPFGEKEKPRGAMLLDAG